MTTVRRPIIVVLGSISKMPVAGEVWLTAGYLLGLQRLGFEVFYVEAHARTPTTLMERPQDESSALAAGYIDSVMRRLDLADRWAFEALHDDGRVYGLSPRRLRDLYRDAACVINLHGGTLPRPEHLASERLVYLETDPVEFEIQLHLGDQAARDMLAAHSAFFTYGTNLGRPDCGLPVAAELQFTPTLPPVLLDQWELQSFGSRLLFTTIGNWRQEWRDVELDGEIYHWSKHREFLKFLELPARTGQPLELALASDAPEDRRLLEDNGWQVRDAFRLSADIDAYRRYIVESRGEFTVAKDQNVRLRTGWFSDRSATYLAAGCPVVTQDTGFGQALPTGEGLFSFSTLPEIVEAIERINRDHPASVRAARELAREHFDAERVLGAMIDELGLRPVSRRAGERESAPLPSDTPLAPVSRWPTVLSPATNAAVMGRRLPRQTRTRPGHPAPQWSVIVVTHENLVFTRLCLESVLAAAGLMSFELIVIDNGSGDGTPEYLEQLAARDVRVRFELGSDNRGFPAAVNRGLRAARGEFIALLNNDTIVVPGWLDAFAQHLQDPQLGLLSAVSNRAATQAQIDTDYETYGELFGFAARQMATHQGECTPIQSLTLFCAALRAEVVAEVGLLDERFGLGMFEDDDYVVRVRRAGYAIACAEDVFVHHFGQASLGWLARSGSYGALFAENRRRYDEKWATRWAPHPQRHSAARERMIAGARSLVDTLVPDSARILVISKGDDKLIALGDREASHFPAGPDGAYAGFHPPDGGAAITELELRRAAGADHLLIPKPSLWWLDHYTELREHLNRSAQLLARDDEVGALYRLDQITPGKKAA